MSKYNKFIFAVHRRAVILLMVLTATVLAISLILIWPNFANHTAALYGTTDIDTEKETYCPGDRAFYTVDIERKTKGVVVLLSQWCRVGSFCSTSTATSLEMLISEPEPPQTVRTHRTVPYFHTMRPGQIWRYEHGNHLKDHADGVEIYRVFVKLADDCPQWENLPEIDSLGPPLQ